MLMATEIITYEIGSAESYNPLQKSIELILVFTAYYYCTSQSENLNFYPKGHVVPCLCLRQFKQPACPVASQFFSFYW